MKLRESEDLGNADHASTMDRWRSSLLFSSIFPSTYSITVEGMISVTALVATTTALCHFRFCFLVPVALCKLGLTSVVTHLRKEICALATFLVRNSARWRKRE